MPAGMKKCRRLFAARRMRRARATARHPSEMRVPLSISSEAAAAKRDWLGRAKGALRAASRSQHKVSRVAKDLAAIKELTEVVVSADTYHVSPEPMLLIADLDGALALCLHDEGRAWAACCT